jgi:hypothetical protein
MRFLSKLGLIVALCFPVISQASASTLTVNFTAQGTTSNPWIVVNSPPFGLSSNPTLSGDVVIDTTNNDPLNNAFYSWGASNFISVNWATGNKTWTLADINGPNSYVLYSYGQFLSFFIEWSNPSNNLGSNNTVGVWEIGTPPDYSDNHIIYCNGCVTVTSTTIGTSETPLPAALPLFATGLGALGLLGWRRKRKAAAALAT